MYRIETKDQYDTWTDAPVTNDPAANRTTGRSRATTMHEVSPRGSAWRSTTRRSNSSSSTRRAIGKFGSGARSSLSGSKQVAKSCYSQQRDPDGVGFVSFTITEVAA